MKEYTKFEAERLLGVSQTSFYKYVKNLGIQLINKVNEKGKITYIRAEDLDKIMASLGKAKIDHQNSMSFSESEAKNSGTEESELEIIRQENFTLRLKTREQDEIIKSKEQVITLYKEQQHQMQMQRNNAQNEFKGLYTQFVKVSTQSTAYLIISIALFIVLLVFILLVLFKKLQL
ncbi:hypothetical protein [Chryseobacterium sp. HMWF001]|nr:hypothetical protein [Chryseobacterium sp. HMWF001]PTT76209.1 hypothetical protein DBR25_06595 [Chryseobacterium sp. HMWF001]